MKKYRAFWVLGGLALVGCATAVAPDPTPTGAAQTTDTDAGPTAPDYGVGSTGDDDAGTSDDTGTPSTPPQDSGPPPTSNDSGPPPPPAAPPLPTAGEIAISEVMYNPSGSEPDEEWFELTNLATTARTLSGLELLDGSGNTHTIASSPALVIQPGAYVVLARNKTTAVAAGVASSAIVYQYASLTLANGTTGGLSIKNGATTLASVPFGQWTAAYNGESIQLKVMTSPATPSSWCFSPNEWDTFTDYGSPGQASDCP